MGSGSGHWSSALCWCVARSDLTNGTLTSLKLISQPPRASLTSQYDLNELTLRKYGQFINLSQCLNQYLPNARRLAWDNTFICREKNGHFNFYNWVHQLGSSSRAALYMAALMCPGNINEGDKDSFEPITSPLSGLLIKSYFVLR